MGGGKKADKPDNLIGLCRACHDRMGDRIEYKDPLRERHQEVMDAWNH